MVVCRRKIATVHRSWRVTNAREWSMHRVRSAIATVGLAVLTATSANANVNQFRAHPQIFYRPQPGIPTCCRPSRIPVGPDNRRGWHHHPEESVVITDRHRRHHLPHHPHWWIPAGVPVSFMAPPMGSTCTAPDGDVADGFEAPLGAACSFDTDDGATVEGQITE